MKDIETNTPCETILRSEVQTRSLNARLAAYRKSSERLRPEFVHAYERLVARLELLDRGAAGPQLGERMPEFNLPDEQGRLISLSSLVQKGPVVISFNRGHWCPYCKLELRALAANYGRINELGACVVSIMPDTARFTGRYMEANELPFSILSDIDLGYSLSLGLIFWVGAEIRQLYEDVGVELEKYHDNDSFFLPMAAKFIVGQDTLIKARLINLEFRERMEPKAIIAVLENLRAARTLPRGS